VTQPASLRCALTRSDRAAGRVVARRLVLDHLRREREQVRNQAWPTCQPVVFIAARY